MPSHAEPQGLPDGEQPERLLHARADSRGVLFPRVTGRGGRQRVLGELDERFGGESRLDRRGDRKGSEPLAKELPMQGEPLPGHRVAGDVLCEGFAADQRDMEEQPAAAVPDEI